MLLTKTVKMRWSGSNKKHYEGKGYTFVNFKDEFEVRVEDLPYGSNMFVSVKCDCEDCKNPYLKPIKWQIYNQQLHEDGKYYCRDCSIKLFGNNKRNKIKVKEDKSFEQWCIENNRQDILDRWDTELNGHSPNEVTYGSAKKFYFKCPRGIHESELKSIGSFTNGQEGSMYCNKCNSFGQYLIDAYGENALNLYWDYDKNEVDPFEITKSCISKRVWIICQNVNYHESYDVPCGSFYKGSRCPYCNKNSGKAHPKDSLGQYLEDNDLLYLWSDKNKKSPYEYPPKSTRKAYFKCPDGKHDDTYRTIHNTVSYDFRCPDCVRERDESFLQEKVRIYLENLGYNILHENKCTIIPQNPKSKKGHMPYDNEVKELKLIIEVHGSQHYKIEYFHKLSARKHKTTPEYEFRMQQVRDRYKRIYAKMNNYYYLEIPYWTNNTDNEWKQLIDDKIQEILNYICK